MNERFTGSVVEDAALAWLEALGYQVLHGPDISPVGDTLTPALSQRERANYSDIVLEGRLRQALVRLNPYLPPEALEDAYRELTRVDAPSLVEPNRAVHRCPRSSPAKFVSKMRNGKLRSMLEVVCQR